jgi:diguanylate cyclase (GGDEF)-like protein/PAS domain S-box-containing protein
VRLAVWAVTCAVVHALVRQLRARSRELAEQRQQYRSLFDHNPDAVYALDHLGRFTAVNAAGYKLIGYSAAELLGKPFDNLLAEEEVDDVRAHFTAALAAEPQSYRSRVRDRYGKEVEVAITNLPIIVDGQVIGVYGIAKDISAYSALEAALTRQALHDPLTGLANRTLLNDRVEHALAGRQRTNEPVSLLMLDLDEFKQVNDTLGHAAGDAVLVEVATRLRRCIRVGDTVARMGGDEFALVLPGADEAGATVVADRILGELEAPMPVDEEHVTVGSSVGIAPAGRGDVDVVELLAQADQALYAAKRAGRGRLEVFHPRLRPAAHTLPAVSVHDARAWAGYITELRADIASAKDARRLPSSTRAPGAVQRTLEQLLAGIDRLPGETTQADLPLPERTALEDFFFHQTAVHHWADALAREGVLHTRRPEAADRFWADLEGVLTSADDTTASSTAP